MNKKTIDSTIKKAIEKAIPSESEAVKKYIAELVRLTFAGLRCDLEARSENGKRYTTKEDLRFAINITLYDVDTPAILEEARNATK